MGGWYSVDRHPFGLVPPVLYWKGQFARPNERIVMPFDDDVLALSRIPSVFYQTNREALFHIRPKDQDEAKAPKIRNEECASLDGV